MHTAGLARRNTHQLDPCFNLLLPPHAPAHTSTPHIIYQQVGSIFEYVDGNAVFGVVQPDSPLWAPILGFFAFTGIPSAGVYCWFVRGRIRLGARRVSGEEQRNWQHVTAAVVCARQTSQTDITEAVLPSAAHTHTILAD